jgi:endonuclease/exonuclease/phosphatase family metal-dependent hydrolase
MVGSEGAMRIATYNVKDLFLPKEPAHEAIFARKIERIAEQILLSQAAVVALQEVGEPEALERLCAAGLADYQTVIGTPDERGIRCAVLSRLPIVNSKVHVTDQLPFPVFAEGDSQPYVMPLRRGIVQVDVTWPRLGVLTVFTHHMKSNLPRRLRKASGDEQAIESGYSRGEAIVRSSVMRSAEALYLRKLVDEAQSDYVCVLGDFNDDRHSPSLRILAGDRDAARPLWQMIDRVPEHKRFSTLHRGRPSLIDHILVTPSLSEVAWEADIQNEDLRDHGPHVPGAPPSDDSDHALYWLQVDLSQSRRPTVTQ